MTCNEKLKADGKPYPRQCRICKFGPCTEKSKDDATARLKHVAGLIQKLSYRDMQTLGAKLGDALEEPAMKVADALLSVADDILGDKAADPMDDLG